MREELKNRIEGREPWLPEKWDGEADLVIVGYGGAGAMAAIAAKYAGADCIVLEKSKECDGGNTAVSGGHVHTACGVDVDEWLEICRHGSHGRHRKRYFAGR